MNVCHYDLNKVCKNCGYQAARYTELRECKATHLPGAKVCRHLGDEVANRAGATVKVNCGCNGEKSKQVHAAHKCEVNRRCLPTLTMRPSERKEWNQRKPESDLYTLCQWCKQWIIQIP